MSIDNLSKARARLVLSQPFFGTLAMGTPFEISNKVPTAATDMRKVYFNPDFIEKLTIDQLIFLIVHEILHIAFAHGVRKHGRDHMIWNMAGDYAINQIAKDDGFKVLDDALIDPQYKDMSADEIYDKLLQDAEENPQGGGSGEGGEGDDDGPPMGGIGEDVLDPDVKSQAEGEALRREIQGRVAQAANAARMAGKLSAGLERLIDDIINPGLPWEEMLRDYMTRYVDDEENWGVRNGRIRDFYIPARKSEATGTGVVIGDTSGSITPEVLSMIAGCASEISTDLNPEELRVVWADTEVCHEETFEPGDPIELHPAGWGGTDMRVPLKHVEKYDPEFVILVTDGYTPWPDQEPPYPLIVCCTSDTDVPIGENVVRVHV